jgi:hypothetical protein
MAESAPNTPQVPAQATEEEQTVDPAVAQNAATRRGFPGQINALEQETENQRGQDRKMRLMMEDIAEEMARENARQMQSQMAQPERTKTPSEMAVEGNVGGYATQMSVQTPQGQTTHWQQRIAKTPKY